MPQINDVEERPAGCSDVACTEAGIHPPPSRSPSRIAIVGNAGLARKPGRRPSQSREVPEEVAAGTLMEMHLRQRTAYLDALLMHNPLGIIVLDTFNRIQMCN